MPRGSALLVESKRTGVFVFEGGDLSGLVAADPKQGVYLAPTGDPTGKQGAWVRAGWDRLDIRWFGAVLDNTTDDSAAVLAAIAMSKALAVNTSDNGFYKSGPRVWVPPVGKAFMGSTTLDITHTLILEGESNAHNGTAYGSALRWSDRTTGIRIQAHDTSGANTVDGAPHFSGGGTIIRNLALLGGYSGAEGEFHGIHAKARFTAEHVLIGNFPGSGVHIDATSLSPENGTRPEGNSNLFRLADCSLIGNRDGIFTKGGDANAGTIYACDFSYNRRWGVNEQSFLGNTYSGCHADGNGMLPSLPSVVSHGGNRFAVRDGHEAAASKNAPPLEIGDNEWWYFYAVGGPSRDQGMPAWSVGMKLRAGGPYRTTNVNGRNVVVGCYSEGSSGPSQFVYPTVVLGGLHGAGIKGTGVNLRNELGTLRVESIHSDSIAVSRSLTLGQVPDSQKRLETRPAPPTAGAFNQGDIVFNSAPTAGSPMGWMCITRGSPGIWKPMANLAT